MRTAALRHFVCPKTEAALRLTIERADGDEVIAGHLEGPDGAIYRIRDGIPDFFSVTSQPTQTTTSFAQKWERHRYYRKHTGDFYTQWYLQRYGFITPEGLRDFLAPKRFILDAGTGTGRDAGNFLAGSSAEVFAVDAAGEALRVARADIDDPRLSLLRGDIDRLPFSDGFFDFINCDQVIHHTPDPEATFAHLSAKLRTGGHICCYVYKKKAPIREFADDYVRRQISKLSAEEAMKACEGITRLGRTLADLNVELNVEEDIPLLGIKKGRIDLQRFFHWNLMKCFWNEQFDFFTNNVVNFDWYHPEHCHRFEPDSFRAWFSRGWEIEAWDVQESGISCRARKT